VLVERAVSEAIVARFLWRKEKRSEKGKIGAIAMGATYRSWRGGREQEEIHSKEYEVRFRREKQ